MCPLNAVSEGNIVLIENISGSEITNKRLMEMGFSKGTPVKMMRNDIGALIVMVGETRLALARALAQKIIVVDNN